ncbi:putative E3 ubiquitin-protein ligase ARI6 [Colletotrichum spaethianum]|uniref:RBR-type E3 ubiquitin transferase n=1 Tax=Colletotrichum spaethianum TaxID=700344 RepID=A0AA37P0F9_9PEZI|nr:putative E3 ubiquitin-protein ligase ARI6 [Colletotrichum spaethianum]GKT45560.1 putative E3 ubiquitin-protein ligase ARI6 [Colletotrichum spaethianum]
MPRTPKAAPYRRGRVPVDNGYDSYDEEPPSGGREREGERESSARGRSPRSNHQSRTRRVYESRRSSRYSESASETESDEESETSVSTQEEKRERRRGRDRRERERCEKPARQTVVERRRPPADDKTPKRRRKIKKIIYMEEDGSTEPTPRQSMDEYSRSPSRHRSHISRPASDRHYSRQRSHSPGRRSNHHRPSPKTYEISKPPSSSKRLVYEIHPARGESDLILSRNPRRHPSQTMYPETRTIRRSNTVSGASHVTSHTHSTASSNRRSSSFLGNLLTGSSVSYSSEKTARVECVVCMDDFPSSKIAKLKCGHRMCSGCLKRHFKISITDPQEMPPKCCSENIALKHVDHLFSAEFKKKWNRKFQEYSARNRIYCPSRKCGAWIKPSYIRKEGGRKYGKCGQCRTKVCCSCNGRWHSSRECPNDEETTRFLDQAKDEGWKRCYKCNHMVELKEGCNHMTCLCGAQFCMVCGTKWKSCDCPWFNYDTADVDQLRDMQMPAAIERMERLDLTESSRSMRSTAASSAPPLRSRSQEYDSRLMRRFQENRDEGLARALQSYEVDDDVYDRGYGDIVGVGNTAGHFMNDDYRREPEAFASAPVPPAPTPPAAFERPAPTDYMSGVNRARGVPPDPLGQRLAERFSEFRSSPSGPRPGMMPPPPVPPLGPLAAPPMGPLSMAAPMMMGPPPPIPLLRRHTIEEEMYNRTTRPSERVVPGRTVHDYEMEAAVHAPRSRRRMREEPKSSTLAGLTGVGRGMNRVHEWRNHVRPGMPEGEPTAMA